MVVFGGAGVGRRDRCPGGGGGCPGREQLSGDDLMHKLVGVAAGRLLELSGGLTDGILMR